MAKAVGLDAGEYEVKVVELEGSPRKARLSRVVVEPVGESAAHESGEVHAMREADATMRALQESGIRKDNMVLGFPCREAVLRLLLVPFVGHDQIRKVIKFEAEGEIHSHNVDDMVVDFYSIEELDAETKVLVSAVPKAPLRMTLMALEQSGVEPTLVDLDTMALFRAAELCGAFESRDDADGGDLPVPAAAPCRVVLDLGARSTRILVIVHGRLVDMRALRAGADSVAAEIATQTGVDLSYAREAVAESLRTDDDYFIEEGEDGDDLPIDDLDGAEAEGDGVADAEGNGDGEVAVAERLPTRISHVDVVAARDRSLARLRRELVRFSTSVPSLSNVEEVWVTGGASTIPGIVDLIEEVFEAKPQQLDVLQHVSHKLDEDEAAALSPKVTMAVGLALAGLGGQPAFNFRQEELAFTKGFDRIKFPLAIACMLALFLVLVLALRSRRELTTLGQQYGALFSEETTERRGRVSRKVQFHGYVGMLTNPPSSWFATQRFYDPKDYQKLVDKLLRDDTFTRLKSIRSAVRKYNEKLQEEAGIYSDLRLGSGLGAIVELAEVVRGAEKELGRFLLTKIDLKLPPRDDGRHLTFDLVFRSDGKSTFREKSEALKGALRDAAAKPDSCFLEIDDRNTKEVGTFNKGEGAEGHHFRVRLKLKPEDEYPIFPKGGVMRTFFESLDFYKVIILLSLVLIPVVGFWAYSLEKELGEARKSIRSATRDGGDLEEIGKYQKAVEEQKRRKLKQVSLDDYQVYFEKSVIGGAPRLRLSDIQVQRKPDASVTRKKATDSLVSIAFKKPGREKLTLSQEELLAVLFNCEAQSQIWKLRDLSIRNAGGQGCARWCAAAGARRRVVGGEHGVREPPAKEEEALSVRVGSALRSRR